MGNRIASALLAIIAVTSAPAIRAQPADFPIAAADGTPLPPGIAVRKDKTGSVYVDRKGRVLYGMDMRTVLRWAPDPAKYCVADCKAEWEPLLAPADAVVNLRYPQAYRDDMPKGMVNPQKAPDWTVIAGADGPQWVHKGWHVVFTRRADSRSTAYDGAGGRTWNTLKYVPPRPAVVLPATVTMRFQNGRYVLADAEGRLLFTGNCASPCQWHPLPAPMAGLGAGDWKVSLAGDSPRWSRKGKPVFVSTDSDPAAVPRGGTMMQP